MPVQASPPAARLHLPAPTPGSRLAASVGLPLMHAAASLTHTSAPLSPIALPPLQNAPETEQEKQLKEEADIMRHVTQKAALKTYAELAKDISFTQSIVTGWKAPLKYRLMSDEEHQVGGGRGGPGGGGLPAVQGT